ncbi:MAG: hypothetical protein NVSMB57_04550 [Actinomycetota bacterium]
MLAAVGLEQFDELLAADAGDAKDAVEGSGLEIAAVNWNGPDAIKCRVNHDVM